MGEKVETEMQRIVENAVQASIPIAIQNTFNNLTKTVSGAEGVEGAEGCPMIVMVMPGKGRRPVGAPVESFESVVGAEWSDGDETHKPPSYLNQTLSDGLSWRVMFGTKWAVEELGLPSNKRYKVDALPAGYEVWEHERVSKQSWLVPKRDLSLYGHPSRKTVPSPMKFYPHFKWLMAYTEGLQCECELCAKMKRRGADVSFPTSRTRQAICADPTEDESKSRSSTILLTLLKDELEYIEHYSKESESLDWEGPRDGMIENVQTQHAFVPRVGELVLYLQPMSTEPRSDELMGGDLHTIHSEWRGGMIVEAPDQDITAEDLAIDTAMQASPNISHFRVQGLENPNLRGEGGPPQSTYAPLAYIRPLAIWQDVLFGIPEAGWDASIVNCLTAIATYSPTKRYAFKGRWPQASLFYEGLFHGPESLWIGDAIRLMPTGGGGIAHEVMIVEEIVSKHEGLAPNNKGQVTLDSAAEATCVLKGPMYTLDPSQSFSKLIVDGNNALPKCMPAYGQWFHVHQPSQCVEIDVRNILGRLFDLEAVQQWLPNFDNTMGYMNFGAPGLQHARTYSAEKYNRIQPDQGWYWGSHRAQCLGIAGVKVLGRKQSRGKGDPQLEPEGLNAAANTDEVGLGMRSARHIKSPQKTKEPDADGDEAGQQEDYSRFGPRWRPANTRKEQQAQAEERDEGPTKKRPRRGR